MTATSTPVISQLMLNSFNDGFKQAARLYWQIFLSFLFQHWLIVTVILVAVFIIAFVRAKMGRWGMFGSVLYHYFYFGILFVVGLIWGPDIFVSNVFNLLCTVALYPLCYFLVGRVLNKFGLRKRQ